MAQDGISRRLQAIFGWDGYFQVYNTPFKHLELLDYTEKRDLYMPGGINGGQKTLFDCLHDKGVPFHVSNWRLSEEDNLSRLARVLDGAEVEFAYLYLAAMDGLLHAEGTGSAQVTAKVAWYEQKLRDIIALAHRRYRDVVLSVFSDHGMTDTRETSNLMLRVEALDLRYGVDYAAVYDSTMARFWFMTERARRRIVSLLATEERGRVLTRSELVELGVDFENHEYGEVLFLMDPGVLLCPSFMRRQPIAGRIRCQRGDGVAIHAAPPSRTRRSEAMDCVLAEPQGRHRRDGSVRRTDRVATAAVRLLRHRARPSPYLALQRDVQPHVSVGDSTIARGVPMRHGTMILRL